MNTYPTQHALTPTALLLALLLIVPLTFTDANQTLFLWLNHHGGIPELAAFWQCVTILGDSLVALALVNLLSLRYPRVLAAGLVAALIATVLSRGLKAGFAFDRPLAVLGDQVHVIGEALHNFSFPSGHTVTIFVLAGIGIHAIRNPLIQAALLLLACLVGGSRVVVGAHWPVDVLFGAAVGYFSAQLGWWIAGRWQWGGSRQGQQVLAMLFWGFALLLFALKTGYPLAHNLQMLIAVSTSFVGFYAALSTFYPNQRVIPGIMPSFKLVNNRT